MELFQKYALKTGAKNSVLKYINDENDIIKRILALLEYISTFKESFLIKINEFYIFY